MCSTKSVIYFGATPYAYDGDGNQTQVVDSFGGTQTSVYDLQDRLITRDYTGEGQELRVDFTHGATGQVNTETRYDMLSGSAYLAGTDLVATTDTGYDADGNVTSIQSTDSSSAIINSFTYTYDRAGNLSAETDTQLGATTTTTYSYDAANQLLSTGGASYTYDANGNRNSTGYTTGLDNELTSDGAYNYTYDASGNEITKTNIATSDKWTYGYSPGGQMISAVETDSSSAIEVSVEYKYDALGNRLEVDVTEGGITTVVRYAYDMGNPAKAGALGTSGIDIWATLNGSGSLTSRQLQGDGIDQHFAYITGGGTAYWYLTDHLGSIRTVLDNSGAVKDAITYDAYGNITSESDADYRDLYAWTGRELDAETGLQYNRARYYDPGTARWISQDPMGFDAGDSNLYRYANNRITDKTDSSGLDPEFQLTVSQLNFIVGFDGSFTWVEKFRLNSEPKNGGWIIQEITVTWTITDANNQPITIRRTPNDPPLQSPVHFWEAFKVEGPQDRKAILRFISQVTDTWSWPEEPCTKGVVTNRGVAEFYPSNRLPTLPASFISGNPATITSANIVRTINSVYPP